MDWKDVPVSFVKGRGKWIEVYHIRVGCETFQVLRTDRKALSLKPCPISAKCNSHAVLPLRAFEGALVALSRPSS